jgi:hypothetical protein
LFIGWSEVGDEVITILSIGIILIEKKAHKNQGLQNYIPAPH